MNILQVCSAASLGGGERHVIDLTRALIERGHRLHLVVRPGSPLQAPLAGWPVTFHELPLRNSLDLASVWRLSQLIRRERIEVLHAHVGRDYLVCGMAARLNP
ncbi:MAG: glycosyltransferase, partial [Acidobacteriota bacterium]